MDKGIPSRIANLLLIAFLIIIVLLSSIKLLFPAEDYRQQITQHLTESIGQPVEIIGSVEWYLSPFPSLYADSVVAKQSKIALEQVSLSFNVLDLLFLKVSPSSVQIKNVALLSHLKPKSLLSDASIYFNESAVFPSAFKFVRPGHVKLNVQGDIKQVEPQRFYIEGLISTHSDHKTVEAFKEASFQLNLTTKSSVTDKTSAGSKQPNSTPFDLSLSAGPLTLESSGAVTVSKSSISVQWSQLKTPNMTLVGTSEWSRENTSVKNVFNSPHIEMPASCFQQPYTLNSNACYDLAVLMMLPGESTLNINSLIVNTLKSHQHALDSLLLEWQQKNDSIMIKRASANALNGALKGQANIHLAAHTWDFDIQGEGIQVESLLQALDRHPQLVGTGRFNLKGHGELQNQHITQHKITGEIIVKNGQTSLFNLEKELCTQVKGVVITNSINTPFKQLTLAIDKDNNHLKIPYFVSELDGATINGQGEFSQDKTLQLVMNVKIDKEQWTLCKLPRALTAIEWPLTCKKQLNEQGNCSINLKQMGISALLLAEDPDRQEKAKQQIEDLKKNKKVKKVLNRFEKWLNE